LARSDAHDRRSIQAFEQAVKQAAARKAGAEVPIVVRDRRYSWTAKPVVTEHGGGAVAWLSPQALPVSQERFAVIEAVVARVEIATELVHQRAEASVARSMLNAITRVSALVREKGRRPDLATRFLDRLAHAASADQAAIGKVAGSSLVIEAVYPKTGTQVSPGDRFPMTGRFVSTSLRTRRPVGSNDVRLSVTGTDARGVSSPVRHALSVPLVVLGRVSHVILLSRSAPRPFGANESRLVQAVAGAALLCIAVSSGSRPGS
jgi:hypothetical protein